MNVLEELGRGDWGMGVDDHRQIVDLLARYAVALDDRDFDNLATLFVDDAQATFSGVRLAPGRKAIIDHLRAIADLAATTHLLGQPVITVSGDRATAATPAVAHLLVDTPTGRVVRTRGLRYSDVLRRVEGRWQIAERVHRVMWMHETPAAHA